jgi:hypothetical protein
LVLMAKPSDRHRRPNPALATQDFLQLGFAHLRSALDAALARFVA